jgi:hypothetical protein
MWPITENLLAEIRTWRKEFRQAVAEEREPGNSSDDANRIEEPWDVLSPHNRAVQEAKKERDKQHRTQEGIRKATVWAVVAAIAYAGIAAFQWSTMRDATNAATKAANTAASQLELSQRPWINFDTIVDAPLSLSGDSVLVSVRLTMRNSGPSPAMNVAIAEGLAADPTNIFDFREAVCGDATKWSTTSPIVTDTVFPNVTLNMSPHLPSGTFTKNLVASRMSPEPFWKDKILQPALVVCVAYRPSFNPTSVYHTSYVFALLKVEPGERPSSLFTIGENVPPEHLKLQLFGLMAIRAD